MNNFLILLLSATLCSGNIMGCGKNDNFEATKVVTRNSEKTFTIKLDFSSEAEKSEAENAIHAYIVSLNSGEWNKTQTLPRKDNGSLSSFFIKIPETISAFHLKIEGIKIEINENQHVLYLAETDLVLDKEREVTLLFKKVNS